MDVQKNNSGVDNFGGMIPKFKVLFERRTTVVIVTGDGREDGYDGCVLMSNLTDDGYHNQSRGMAQSIFQNYKQQKAPRQQGKLSFCFSTEYCVLLTNPRQPT